MNRFRHKHEFNVYFNYDGFKSKPKIADLSFLSSSDTTSTSNYYDYLTNIGD